MKKEKHYIKIFLAPLRKEKLLLTFSLVLSMDRLSTGIEKLDLMLEGGIPRGFLVAVTGEPGTGKSILCQHFAWQGYRDGDKVIYVTTEESRSSILEQAELLGMDMKRGVDEGRIIVIDALLASDEWSLTSLDPEALVQKVIDAKKKLGYGRARLVIDSLSAFWLDKPAMARKYSYYIKKVFSKWDFTVLATSQYAITTSIPGDQLVAVMGENGVEVIPIQELFQKAGSDPLNLKCLSLGEDLRARWSNILAVSRHEPKEPIYRIKLEGGRCIEVTGDHSVYVWRDGIKILPAREIRIGDFLLSLRRLSLPEKSWEIDIISLMRDSGVDPSLIYLRGIKEDLLGDPKVLESIRTKKVGHDSLRYYWRKKRVLPLDVLISAGIENSEEVSLAYRRKGRTIALKKGVKTRIPVDWKLGRLLGYYAAEGHLGDNRVIITFGRSEEAYAEDAARLFKEIFGVEAKVHSTGKKISVEVNSGVVRRVLEHALGVKTGSHQKEVPPIIFISAPDVEMNFLIGLYRGDGHLRKDSSSLTLTTASEKLLNGVVLLLMELGVLPHISPREKAYNLVVSYAAGLEKLRPVVEAIRPNAGIRNGLRSSALEGLPRDLLVQISSALGNPKKGTYTNLNKVRVSYWKVRRFLNSPNVKKFLHATSMESLADFVGAFPKKSLMSNGGRLNRDKILGKIEMIRSLLDSDLVFLRVKDIQILEERKPVYDITVEGDQNFFAGLGWVLCHNSEAFGFGIEHIADGIIRFRRSVRGGRLRRFLMIEKMRQTNHDLRMYEIEIVPGRGMDIIGPAEISKEDYALPKKVMDRIAEAKKKSESEVP